MGLGFEQVVLTQDRPGCRVMWDMSVYDVFLSASGPCQIVVGADDRVQVAVACEPYPRTSFVSRYDDGGWLVSRGSYVHAEAVGGAYEWYVLLRCYVRSLDPCVTDVPQS